MKLVRAADSWSMLSEWGVPYDGMPPGKNVSSIGSSCWYKQYCMWSWGKVWDQFNGAENVGQYCPKNQGFSKRTVVRAAGGMDPFDFGKEAFNDHLQSLADESLYESCTLPTQLKIWNKLLPMPLLFWSDPIRGFGSNADVLIVMLTITQQWAKSQTLFLLFFNFLYIP